MKILEIKSCAHCRYATSALRENGYYCSHCGDFNPTISISVNGDDWIPKWCPLEDAEPEGDKK